MNCKVSWLTLAAALILGACSSGNSSAPPPVVPPPPAGVVVSGAVVDGPVSGATISAFAVSAAGAVGTTALATATTSATGSYSLTLPAGTTGAILLTSTGGSFIDDVTGKTVNAPNLSVLLPSVSGTAPVTAQLTPLTTIAAQVALATSSATNSVGSVATAINTAIGAALGGQSDIVGTPLVDVATAGCAATASQASIDASLVLAGINQLAATNNVSTADLIQAILADIESDNTFDGTASGLPLTVPLSGGTVMLCTIEGNCPGTTATGLAQQLGAAVAAFQKSGANTCAAAESSTQQTAFANANPAPPAVSPNFKYKYTLDTGLSGFTGSAAVKIFMNVNLVCPDDNNGKIPGASVSVTNNGPIGLFALSNGQVDINNDAGATIVVGTNPTNDCGQNTWTLTLSAPAGLQCAFIGPSTGAFISSDGGNTNMAVAPGTVSCSAAPPPPMYSVGGTIAGFTAGSMVLEDNGGDDLTIAAPASTFNFPADLTSGATYDVTVKTQPSGLTCTVSPNAPQTIGNGNVSNVAVSCSPTVSGTPGAETVYVIDSTYRLFEFDAQGNFVASANLPGSTSSVGNLNGGGITVDANNVYVTLGAPSTQIAAFNRTTLAPVILSVGQFTTLNTPREIVFDSANSQFYVANGGSTVTIYGAGGGFLSTFNQTGPGIYGPSGIAYDSIDNTVWVANYTGGGASTTPTYGIAEFNPSGTIVKNFPTANTNAPTPFAPPVNTGHELPYTISYCANALAVGYISDSSGSGKSEAGSYNTSGTLLAPFAGTITNLHASACDPSGNVFLAADNGLLEYNNATGASIALPAGGFAGIKAPIYGVGVGPASGLNSPEGLVYSNGSLYVANSGNNQVLVYAVQTNSSGVVTGMTLSGAITADLNDPVRLALDSAGHLFVANLGNNTVSVYDTNNANAEITAAGSKPLISGGSLNRPLGVAVDSKGNVYVANNGANSISVYQPVTSGSVSAGYTEASFSPVSADAVGNLFPAPGVLSDVNVLGQDYLLVGIGSTTAPNHVYLYDAPFSGAPTLVFDLSSVTNGVSCTTMPTGPTGIAVFLSQSQPLASQILVTSYYNNDVTDYLASQLIGSSTTCPTPITTGAQAQINGPEGVAVDTSGTNVFVSNAGANTITVYGAGTALSSPPVFTLHN